MHSPLTRTVLIVFAATVGTTVGSVSLVYGADMLLEEFSARVDNYTLAIAIPLALAPMTVYPLAYVIYRMETAQAALARMARTDSLTDVANRRGFFDAAEAAFAGGGSHALMMVDIDRFKLVNDLFGHAAGDDLLRRLAKLICESVQDTKGIVGRIGGEEFAILLPQTNADTAGLLAERLCRQARMTAFECDGHRIHATLSIGVALRGPGEPFSATMKEADMASYEAKRAGRDRWSLAGTKRAAAAA